MKIGTMEAEKLLALFRALNAHDVAYVVVGALGMSANGIVRSTDDADAAALRDKFGEEVN